MRFPSKKVLSPFFILSIFITECGNWCNDCDEPIVFYRYANHTSYKLIMQRIENGKSRPDSLVVLSTDSVEVKSEWLNRSELDNNQYTLHFYSSPESCLVFKGKIQSNSLDIRSDNYNGFLASKRKYVYQMAIDTNHLDAASPCSTNVSTKL